MKPNTYMARAYNLIKHSLVPLSSREVATRLKIDPVSSSAACKKLREKGALLNVGGANGGPQNGHKARWVINPDGKPPSKRRAPRKPCIEIAERPWVPWYLDVEWPWADNRWERQRTADKDGSALHEVLYQRMIDRLCRMFALNCNDLLDSPQSRL